MRQKARHFILGLLPHTATVRLAQTLGVTIPIPMLSHDSILRNLPSNLDRTQALFFDGLRHAAEIAQLAYTRLQTTLARIATGDLENEERSKLYTSAFLDAWAVVDSIDRFRALWHLLPVPKSETGSNFSELTRPLRDLRNVADHLAQRAAYVVAKGGTALGVLSWVTITDIKHRKALSCAIIPGTVQNNQTQLVVPDHELIELPSGLIHLRAGEYNVSLSVVMPEMFARIRTLEIALKAEFLSLGALAAPARADLLVLGNLILGNAEKIDRAGDA